jgi:hypothetical protein
MGKGKSNTKMPQMASTKEIENDFHLSSCAKMYMASLIDPFNGPEGACMPVAPSVRTRRMRTFVRGTMAVGTNGFGFINAQPLCINNGSTATVAFSTNAVYTNATFAGTTTSLDTSGTGATGVVGVNNNSDYVAGSFVYGGIAGVAPVDCSRLVSLGLRVRYKGTELNRGGRIITFEEADHNYIAVGQTAATVLANESAHEHPILSNSKDWVAVCSSGPKAPSEYEFGTCNSTATPTGVATGPNGVSSCVSNYLMIIIESTAGNLFDFELYQNWEIIGYNIRGKVYNEADDVGVSSVVGTVLSVNDSALDSQHPLMKAVSNPAKQTAMVTRYAQQNVSGWVATLGGVAKSVSGALLALPSPWAKAAGSVLGFGGAVAEHFM